MKVLHCSASIVAIFSLLLPVTGRAAPITANADVEVRASEGPTGNRSTNAELATRTASNRNSAIFMQFDVSSVTPADLLNDIGIRLTIGNNGNLQTGRIDNSANPSFMPTTSFNWYVAPTYATPWADDAAVQPALPGDPYQYTVGGSSAPADPYASSIVPPSYTSLGQQVMTTGMVDQNLPVPAVPVGSDWILPVTAGSALHSAIAAAQTGGANVITLAMEHAWWPQDQVDGNVPSNWINFNYNMNSLQRNPLLTQNGAPYSGADNSLGQFAPTLETNYVPEPSTWAALASFAGLAGAGIARRRRA